MERRQAHERWGEHEMDDPAQAKVEPSKREQQENREREVAGFNVGLWVMILIVAVVIVVGALLVI
jgi:cytoskeletal protein RodZ